MSQTIGEIINDLFFQIQQLPGDEFYSDGDRLMIVDQGTAHLALFDSGADAKEFEVLTRSPNGEDGGGGAHGDGDRGLCNRLAALFNIMNRLKPLLGTPAVTLALQALDERARQGAPHDKGGEAWSEAHDDSHDPGTLAMAAAYYAMAASGHPSFATMGRPPVLSMQAVGGKGFREVCFPWDAQWFKPKTQERCATIAMALLMAQVETNQRAELKSRASMLPSRPFKDLMRAVFDAAGQEMPTGDRYDAALLALKLHSVKQ